jgi:tyrosyl-tRNA synthetase
VPLLVLTGLYASNSEARRAIAQGGLRVNGERVSVAETPLPELVAGEWLVVRLGKRAVRVGRLRP